MFIALIAAAVILEVAGDVLFKQWSRTERTTLLVLGLGVYFAGSVFWAFSLRQEGLARAITVFTVANLAAAVLVGAYLFREELTLANRIGLALAFLSVLLMEW
ncbi:MAG: Uncharacterized protein G01um101431_41 [Parcubacteria group bacterium Gr01-1014_31]|nr:MAG: Uncharacterized protein G01um101431_41 [Parcubacteria group bacterium Gr01-1014_31]